MAPLAGLRRFFLLDVDGSRNVAMEGLRGYAVFLVFFVHFGSIYGSSVRHVNYDAYCMQPTTAVARMMPWGDLARYCLWKSQYGVDLFFLLSGFLICRAIAHSRQKRRFSYRRFLWRRFLRIYPAFLISTAACIAVPGWFWGWPAFDGWNCLGNLTLLFGCPGLAIAPYNQVTWSLFYEFSFYIVAPLLFWLMPKTEEEDSGRQAMGIAGLLAVALLGHVWMPRACMFLFGMLLGLPSEASLGRTARAVPTWLALLVYLGAVAAYLLLPLSFAWFTPVYGAASSLLFLKTCYGEGVLNRLFAWAPLRFLGNISYSFYLFHHLGTATVLWLTETHHISLNGTWRCTVYFATSLAVSLALASSSFAIAERWYFGWSRPRVAPRVVEAQEATNRPAVIAVHVLTSSEVAA